MVGQSQMNHLSLPIIELYVIKKKPELVTALGFQPAKLHLHLEKCCFALIYLFLPHPLP